MLLFFRSEINADTVNGPWAFRPLLIDPVTSQMSSWPCWQDIHGRDGHPDSAGKRSTTFVGSTSGEEVRTAFELVQRAERLI